MLCVTEKAVIVLHVHLFLSDMEAFGHDHVEETMGYEHTVEGMSLK